MNNEERFPAPLRSFLEGLSQQDAKAVLVFLDGRQYAVSEMIEVLCESHKGILTD